MKVRFYIEKRRDEEGKLLTRNRPVFMTVAFHGKRILISTGKKVDHIWWDHKLQRVKSAHPDAAIVNTWLETLNDTASLVWRSLASLSEKPGVKDFRKEFERLRPRFSGGFFDVLIQFMEEGAEKWTAGTYKKVRSFYNQLRDFVSQSSYNLNFNTLNEEFLQKFVDFHSASGRSDVTILKQVNILVWFLNWATRKGYNIYYDYKTFYRLLEKPEIKEVPDLIYLNWEELMTFSSYKSDVIRVERARDLFCLMCFTGIRIAELQNLEKQDVNEESICIKKKNKRTRYIPLNIHSKAILERYRNRLYKNNRALPTLSVVSMNKYVRIIANDAGISREVDNQKGIKLPIHSILTTGTAIPTFIMNAIRLGIPPEIISSYTGVRNDKRIALIQHEMAKSEMHKFNKI